LQKNENFSTQSALPAHERCLNYSDTLYKSISLLREEFSIPKEKKKQM